MFVVLLLFFFALRQKFVDFKFSFEWKFELQNSHRSDHHVIFDRLSLLFGASWEGLSHAEARKLFQVGFVPGE